jgi:fumarate hydratase subunit alpha
MAVVFIEVGQVFIFTAESLKCYKQRGQQGIQGGLSRCSIVEDPLRRVNTGDNTPAVIHQRIVKGDEVKILFHQRGSEVKT